MTSPKIKIGEFKAKLSHYLRMVRKGRELIVTDRDQPVATVLPYVKDDADIKIIPARYGAKHRRKLPKIRTPSNLDATEDFIQDRRDRDFLS